MDKICCLQHYTCHATSQSIARDRQSVATHTDKVVRKVVIIIMMHQVMYDILQSEFLVQSLLWWGRMTILRSWVTECCTKKVMYLPKR